VRASVDTNFVNKVPDGLFPNFSSKAFALLTLLAPVQNQFRFSGSVFPESTVQFLDSEIDTFIDRT
jgi:hypothetical protein